MNAQVLPFACLAQAPAGTAVCVRQRWHPGDHRAPRLGSNELLEWPDPPAPPNPEDRVMAFGDRPGQQHHPIGSLCTLDDCPNVHDPAPHQLNEAAETFTATLEVAADPRARFWRIVNVLVALSLLVAMVCAPAVVIAVYRAVL